MGGVPKRALTAALIGVAVTIGTAAAALAVSGGGYQPGEQDCSAGADYSAAPRGSTEPGCHNLKLNLEDANGQRYAEAGLNQLPTGYPSTPGLLGIGYPGRPNFPHAGCAGVHPGGAGPAPDCGAATRGSGVAASFDSQHANGTHLAAPRAAPDFGPLVRAVRKGLVVYLGADDNLDAGEHDGVVGSGPDGKPDGSSGSVNGPSDGGAVRMHLSPGDRSKPALTNPFPFAGISMGACADGFCVEVTTLEQTLYQGRSGTSGQRDAADYGSKQFDPYDCSSGSQQSEGPSCADGNPAHPQTMDGYRNLESRDVRAQPGAQVYEDPDPQGSPIDPIHEVAKSPGTPLYPIPAAYAGTCGVIVGGGPVARAPAGTPGTNRAGQVVVSTGC